MLEFVTPLLVFLIGVAAGFADSTVGSGGLISIPFLMFLGLPPQVAIATDRLGSAGQTATALFEFWKAKKIRWNYVAVFTSLAIVGAYIGANILVDFNPKTLEKVVGTLLIMVLPFLFLKRTLGVQRINVSALKKGIGLIMYFLLMIYNGFFGTGAGPFSSFNSLFFFGFTIIEANATSIIPWFFLSLSSLIIFARNGIIDYQNGIVLFVGMALGGWLGAHVAVAKGDAWIKRLFIVVVLLAGLKLLAS